MSLMRDVIAMVEEMGEVPGDALLPHFPDRSRRQVFKALQNANALGLIRLVRRGKALGAGGTKGSEPGVYGPVEEVDAPPAPIGPRPFNSVFQMGERAMEIVETARRVMA